jgi:hypothetical protein
MLIYQIQMKRVHSSEPTSRNLTEVWWVNSQDNQGVHRGTTPAKSLSTKAWLIINPFFWPKKVWDHLQGELMIWIKRMIMITRHMRNHCFIKLNKVSIWETEARTINLKLGLMASEHLTLSWRKVTSNSISRMSNPQGENLSSWRILRKILTNSNICLKGD